MANIFNIEQDRLRILNEIEDAQGEITEEMEAMWTINEDEAKSKLDSYAYIVTLKEGEIEMAKAEIVRLNKRIAARESIIDRLETTMQQAVKMFGVEGKPSKITGLSSITFDTEHFKLSVGKSKVLLSEDNEKVTAENFSDDDYNRYSINRKFTNDEIEMIAIALNPDLPANSDVNELVLKLDVKRDVNTKQLKEDLLNGTVVSEGQVELDVTIDDNGNTNIDKALEPIEVDKRHQVNAYIVINEKLKIK